MDRSTFFQCMRIVFILVLFAKSCLYLTSLVELADQNGNKLKERNAVDVDTLAKCMHIMEDLIYESRLVWNRLKLYSQLKFKERPLEAIKTVLTEQRRIRKALVQEWERWKTVGPEAIPDMEIIKQFIDSVETPSEQFSKKAKKIVQQKNATDMTCYKMLQLMDVTKNIMSNKCSDLSERHLGMQKLGLDLYNEVIHEEGSNFAVYPKSEDMVTALKELQRMLKKRQKEFLQNATVDVSAGMVGLEIKEFMDLNRKLISQIRMYLVHGWTYYVHKYGDHFLDIAQKYESAEDDIKMLLNEAKTTSEYLKRTVRYWKYFKNEAVWNNMTRIWSSMSYPDYLINDISKGQVRETSGKRDPKFLKKPYNSQNDYTKIVVQVEDEEFLILQNAGL